jgi:hypothetical protein
MFLNSAQPLKSIRKNFCDAVLILFFEIFPSQSLFLTISYILLSMLTGLYWL